MLLANIIWMACDVVLTPSAARQLPTHAVDRKVKYLVVFFVDGKFSTLFSVLFVVGFTIQVQPGNSPWLLAAAVDTGGFDTTAFGPAEWGWRSLTYGRLQPMRLDRLARAAR